MSLNNIDILEQLKRENGRILYEGREGMIVTRDTGETLLTDIEDGEALCRMIRNMNLPNFEQIVVRNKAAHEAIVKEFGFSYGLPCTQWVFTKSEPPVYEKADIRPLPMELALVAGKYYRPEGNTEPYIRDRIAAGRMWGLFENNQLAGFIGMHDEGAMGLLEILPDFRRKGYGYTLEAFLIDWHLQHGFVPYCHVIDGNEASLHLQKKLGLECAQKPALWLWKG